MVLRKRILYRKARHGKTLIRIQEATPAPPIIPSRIANTATVVSMPLEEGAEPRGNRLRTRARASTEKTKSVIQLIVQSVTTLDAERFKRAAVPLIISTSKTVALGKDEEV